MLPKSGKIFETLTSLHLAFFSSYSTAVDTCKTDERGGNYF